MRRCEECGRDFMPSSRHLRCPSCRSKAICECGRPRQAKSATCADCRTVVKSANGNWKGGKTRHVGRYLEPDESIHHRNGVRDDNRPENLELWTRPQPSGIRVRMPLRGPAPFSTATRNVA